VESAEDITSTLSQANNTYLGQQIQKEVGINTDSNREGIVSFYNIVIDVVCFGAGRKSVADENRFPYSFSTDSEDKLTRGESAYATRGLTVTLGGGTA
jgi:hypothetical protein